MAKIISKNKRFAVSLVLVTLMVFFTNGVHCQSKPNDTILDIVTNAPMTIENDIVDLVDYFQSVAKDSTELVKLFVYWMAQNIEYDVKKFISGDMTYTSVNNTLETRKTMCQGYSELFCEMCEWADIDCEVVVGYVKGFGYNDEFIEKPNHVWNVVFLDNSWKIIDATWASGFIKGWGRTLKFEKKINKQFILANPDTLIRTHFPEEEKWQLLENTISIHEFYIKNQ